ncbi:hypothetical protein HaLaN_21336 [Haematococcus lacustris]|uniref:Uncharacterized protein n=1 Tax=Haematococcus lacustris TaxID=44745 RepID=A0A699ZLZ9_HAELA|nr:hypothetical protein HaLaN_21336 [Haematococcus lacustris]
MDTTRRVLPRRSPATLSLLARHSGVAAAFHSPAGLSRAAQTAAPHCGLLSLLPLHAFHPAAAGVPGRCAPSLTQQVQGTAWRCQGLPRGASSQPFVPTSYQPACQPLAPFPTRSQLGTPHGACRDSDLAGARSPGVALGAEYGEAALAHCRLLLQPLVESGVPSRHRFDGRGDHESSQVPMGPQALLALLHRLVTSAPLACHERELLRAVHLTTPRPSGPGWPAWGCWPAWSPLCAARPCSPDHSGAAGGGGAGGGWRRGRGCGVGAARLVAGLLGSGCECHGPQAGAAVDLQQWLGQSVWWHVFHAGLHAAATWCLDTSQAVGNRPGHRGAAAGQQGLGRIASDQLLLGRLKIWRATADPQLQQHLRTEQCRQGHHASLGQCTLAVSGLCVPVSTDFPSPHAAGGGAVHATPRAG